MPYHIVSQHEHGGYRCEVEQPDLASAISATIIRARESRRRHYIVDEQGKLIDIIQPARGLGIREFRIDQFQE